MEISVGSKVEICSREDGFLGSYYEAKVLCRVGKNKLKVEYLTLLNDEDEKQPLREVVEACDVRPLPPKIRVSGYDILDEVDAYDQDGWWVGRISGRDAFNNYYVYFDSSGDEFAYPFHKLRVHQSYDGNGNWIPSLKKGQYGLPLVEI